MGRLNFERLLLLLLLLLLSSGCSTNRSQACAWEHKRDADYNAAVDAIDTARSHHQQAIDNYRDSSRADLLKSIYEAQGQLDLARDKVIGALGSAKPAASDCD